MPEINVNGVELVYETAGEGTPIVWTPGGWGTREGAARAMAGRFCKEFRVLIWDRRICGISELSVINSESEFHTWADDLHAILTEFKMIPAYFGGRSGGCVRSLLMAHRYPNDVKGLMLQEPPTNNVPDALRHIANYHYYYFADIAEKDGMEALIEASAAESEWRWVISWIADSVYRNPENRERLIKHDKSEFISTMKRWGKWVNSERFHLANLTDDELKNIKAPAIVTAGLNPLHPKSSATDLYQSLNNVVWNNRFDNYNQDMITEFAQKTGSSDLKTIGSVAMLGNIYETYLHQVEKGNFEPDKR